MSAPDWGVTETAHALGMPSSSAHDLLSSLADAGFLQRAGRNRYRLGWKLLGLGSMVLATSKVRISARPEMQALCSRLHVTVHLAVLDADEVVYIDKLTSPRVPVPISSVGTRLSPHCSAIGKVLLAEGSRSLAVRALERCGMPPLTERTIASVDHLLTELEQIRRAGTARDRQEAAVGVCCHAAPIFDGARAVAAISVSVPAEADRRAAASYADMVLAAARRVSHALDALPNEGIQHAIAV